MNKKKIALLLVIITVLAFAVSACSLFGGGEEEAPADGERVLPELAKRFYYVPGESFVVNLKPEEATVDEEGNAKKASTPPLCKATVAMAFEEDKTTDLDVNQQAIRNICVKVLRDTTEIEARADDAIEKLETKLYEELNAFLNMPEFFGVYISDFVVQ